MSARNRILVTVGAVLATGVALVLVDGARPDARWRVLGAERALAATNSGAPFTAGLGLVPGATLSNAFVDRSDAEAPRAGRFWSGRVFYGEDGRMADETVRFPEGAWHEVDAIVIERDVATLLGGEAVRYQVRVTGALSADGAHWMFRPTMSGQGRAGYSIRADLQFDETSRELEVFVSESFDGAATERYAFRFSVEADGTLRPAD